MSHRSVFAAALLAGLSITTACSGRSSESGTEAAGGAVTSSRDWATLKDFNAIEATGPDDVTVSVGKAFAVRVEGDPETMKALEIKVDGGTLQIGRKRGMSNFWGMGSDKGVTVHVSLPAVDGVTLTGSGDIDVDQAQGDALSLALTGSGELTVKAVAVRTLKSDLTGSGEIALAGTADDATFSATGSGNVEAEGLKVGKGEISILGSGDIGFASDGPVAIDIMGSGNATVKGKAQCKVKTMGSGEASCGV